MSRTGLAATTSEPQLHAFDFKAIDELDPSTADGHRVVFDREAPFELRYSETDIPVSDEIGTLEAIRVKVLVRGPENNPEEVRVELSSENDLFFMYTHAVDVMGYTQLQREQKLMIDFREYPMVLSKMINSAIKEPQSYLAVLILGTTGAAKLELVRNMEYKFVDLMSIPFEVASEEMVKVHITYRYNAAKSKLALMHSRLQEINSLVKVKNPSLLVQLHQQGHTGHAAGATYDDRASSRATSSRLRK